MMLDYVFAAVASFALTLFLLPPVIRWSRRWHLLDLPQGRKRHEQPTPNTGGWVLFVAFWAGLWVWFWRNPEHLPEIETYLPSIFIAHFLVFAGGVVDDIVQLKARYKLLIQFGAAAILFVGGLRVDTIYVPFTGAFPLPDALSFVATTIWLLAIINATNIVDGINGLAAGLSILAAVGLAYTAVSLHIPVVTALAIIMIAMLLAFLPFNFPRARMFMGDSGAQSLGFILGVAAIYCPIKSYTVVAMFVPLVALGVPLFELVVSFSRRLLTGNSIMKGDFDHLFHRVMRWGVTPVKTVLWFWGVAAALQVFVFTLFLFDRRIVFSIFLLLMLAVAVWFQRLSRRKEL